MNKVVLMGRLTKNPEIKYAGKDNDMAVARYILAVNRRYKRDGEQEAATAAPEIKAGSVATMKNGAVYGGLSSTRGKAVPAAQLGGKRHTVDKVQTNKGVQEAKLKEINSWVAVASLTIAQAITETGWGTSGLAVEGKALFEIKATKSWKGRILDFDMIR